MVGVPGMTSDLAMPPLPLRLAGLWLIAGHLAADWDRSMAGSELGPSVDEIAISDRQAAAFGAAMGWLGRKEHCSTKKLCVAATQSRRIARHQHIRTLLEHLAAIEPAPLSIVVDRHQPVAVQAHVDALL